LKEKEEFLVPVFDNKLDPNEISDEILDQVDEEEEDIKKAQIKTGFSLNLGGAKNSDSSSPTTKSIGPFSSLISPRGFIPVSKSLEIQSRLEKVTPREAETHQRIKSVSNNDSSETPQTIVNFSSPRKDSKISIQKSDQVYQDLSFL
jgi:hypothetical protein